MDKRLRLVPVIMVIPMLGVVAWSNQPEPPAPQVTAATVPIPDILERANDALSANRGFVRTEPALEISQVAVTVRQGQRALIRAVEQEKQERREARQAEREAERQAQLEADGPVGSESTDVGTQSGGGSSDLPALLLTIRANESGGNYSAYNASGCEGYGCGGAFQLHARYASSWASSAGYLGLSGQAQTWDPATQDAVALWLFYSTNPDGSHWCDWTDYC